MRHRTTTVAAVTRSSSTISPSATLRAPAPKNSGGHSAFNTRLTAYQGSHRRCSEPRRALTYQARQPAMAIRTYSTVHTGPNSQDGGDHEGRRSTAYCSADEDAVSAPIAAAAPTAAANTAAAPMAPSTVGRDRVIPTEASPGAGAAPAERAGNPPAAGLLGGTSSRGGPARERPFGAPPSVQSGLRTGAGARVGEAEERVGTRKTGRPRELADR